MIMASIGHNHVEVGQLVSLIERAETVKEEIAQKQEDLREIFSEAKSSGYNVPVVRQLIKLRAMDPADRAERDAILSLYIEAVGMRP